MHYQAKSQCSTFLFGLLDKTLTSLFQISYMLGTETFKMSYYKFLVYRFIIITLRLTFLIFVQLDLRRICCPTNNNIYQHSNDLTKENENHKSCVFAHNILQGDKIT